MLLIAKCLVTIVLSITYGPMASGVTFSFPSPTTKAFLPNNLFSSKHSFNTLASAFSTFSIVLES